MGSLPSYVHSASTENPLQNGHLWNGIVATMHHRGYNHQVTAGALAVSAARQGCTPRASSSQKSTNNNYASSPSQ
jgi:hypothetical protein